ncbi:MAG: class I SAM-dependent RNA methyltransferase, partial [Salinibacterium sp.]|nr:class I SAM-dependent RNA methyltransferase [Salinibacterium sp.]
LLTAAVQGAIDGERFDPAAANLALYGGVGLLAAAIGDRFGPETSVTTVESDPVAVSFAATNLIDFPEAKAVLGRVDAWLRSVSRRSDSVDRERLARATVILDPPRSGAGREVVQLLSDLAPSQIIYVACDPVAFARDVGYFAERGYRLAGLRAFDLFPHTHHLEAVGTLIRT